MNITKLVNEVMEILDLSWQERPKASRIVSTILGTISSAVQSGDDVTIGGFGTFTSRIRRARYIKGCLVSTTTRTTEPIFCPARRHAIFVPSPTLTAMLNYESNSLTCLERRAMESWYKDSK